MCLNAANENSPKQGTSKGFNLIGLFSLQGLVYIGLVSVATSWVLASFLEEHLLQRDAVVMQQFVQRIAQHHDPHDYFAKGGHPGGETLNDFFGDISHMPDVARINAYRPDRTIVWSSDAGLLGKVFKDNEELAEALTGELVIEKGAVKDHDKTEHVLFSSSVNWFVETYIPIFELSSGDILGVVEIYRIPRALNDSIQQGRLLVWASVIVGGMLLYFSLFRIMHRAQILIESQQQSLLKQERLSTIGELASSVAHSIRNPIASIRSSAELALDTSDSPDINESLHDIIGEADRFDGWIRELLTFASEPGDANAACSLIEVVEQALQASNLRAARQQVEFEVHFQSALPRVRGEHRLLVQVFNSLIANALDAMPQGGRLVIDSVGGAASVRIVLADTGFGIPADKIGTLFDPLVTHKQGGFGIGLALARQIVQRYAGQISLSSESGQGTMVRIELPSVQDVG